MLSLPDSDHSLWRESYPATALYSPLENDLRVDVVIIGAGITGLTSAYLLKHAGLKVAVLEKDTVGGGTTGRTTGKVSVQQGTIYHSLESRLGLPIARAYAAANISALDKIDEIIRTENIACDWHREDNYVFTTDPTQVENLQHDAVVAKKLGLPASFIVKTPLPFSVAGAVRFRDQATFDSQAYVLALASLVHGHGSYVFEHSNVTRITEGQPGHVKTRGGTTYARDIIVATNVPTLPLAARGTYCLLEYPQESYIVAGRLPRPLKGMYISPDKDNFSLLPIVRGGEQLLLIGGKGHVSGLRGSTRRRFQVLAKHAEEKFGVTHITHKWSDRDYMAYDDLPLIGLLYPWSEHLFVASAFRKWGLTNGTAAAMILSDLILGNENSLASTFTPQRLSVVKSIPRVVAQYLTRNN